MNRIDEHGLRVSGANAASLEHYRLALAAQSSWRVGADRYAEAARRESPHFVMAHVLQAYMLVCGRDKRRMRAAKPILKQLRQLRADEREQLHIAAIAAVLEDHFELAKAHLGHLLDAHPRDLLALQVAHSFDYATGDVQRMLERVESVLPAWSPTAPGYHAVLAMHAFALEEHGEFERAESRARAALALNAQDARAHHVMAHVFESSERPEDGVRWMQTHADAWQPDTTVATHGWWHLALFHLAARDSAAALDLYDTRVRAQRSREISDLIDASSLLWRIRLQGRNVGARWTELAAAWEPHIDDAFCSFTDLHAMLAFVGAQDGERARRLELTLARQQGQPTRYGETTRRLGLPACRALLAFGRGDDALAITLLASLPPLAHRLGGSHAQRDVLHLTLLNAIDRMRRPARRRRACASLDLQTMERNFT